MTATLADLYLRLSPTPVEGTGIERQERDGRAWCERHGLTVRQVHVDRSRSGYKDVRREGFEDAVRAVTNRETGTLVVWKVDRLSRRGMGQVGLVLDDVERVGGRLVFVQDGLDFPSQPSARMVLALLSEVARTESATIGLRVRSAKAHLRGQGRWIGGSAPFGLRAVGGQIEPDPETAPIAREVVDRVLEGETLVSIARDLNARSLPSPRGREWRVGTLSGLLKAPALAGLLPETEKDDRGRWTARVRPWRDPETGDVVSIGEGIMTPGERREVLERLEERTTANRRGGLRGGRDYMLTGLLRCGACGGRMSRSGKSYVCQAKRLGGTCPGASAYAEALEGYVAARFLAFLPALEPGDPVLDAVAQRWVYRVAPEAVEARRAAKEALQEAEARLADLEDARYLRGEFPGTEGAARYARLRERLAAAVESHRGAVQAHPTPQADLSPLLDRETLAEAWEAAPVRERRELLRLAVDRIEVAPARGRGYRFVPEERVRVVWAASEEAPECRSVEV